MKHLMGTYTSLDDSQMNTWSASIQSTGLDPKSFSVSRRILWCIRWEQFLLIPTSYCRPPHQSPPNFRCFHPGAQYWGRNISKSPIHTPRVWFSLPSAFKYLYLDIISSEVWAQLTSVCWRHPVISVDGWWKADQATVVTCASLSMGLQDHTQTLWLSPP